LHETLVPERSMLKRHFVSTLVLSLCSLAQADHNDSYAQLRHYQGSYRFPDGTIITGGRMDEGGRVMLSYLDTREVTRGGMFAANGDDFMGLYGTQASIDFDDNGNVMIWRVPSAEPLRVERIMKPETRPATFANGDVQLAGTLYLPPRRSGKLPAVVLAHGSGPTTRYLGPWVTFFVGEGLAVLAFDKRGTGESDGDWRRSTYFDLSSDLLAAAEWLSGQAHIDAARIGLKTSSQSGWYGPHAVEQSAVLSFLIQRAGPAVDIGVGTAHEQKREFEAAGLPQSVIDAAVSFWLALHEMAGRGDSLESANGYLHEARTEAWFEPAFGDWEVITPVWWRLHAVNMKLKPAATTARLDEPVLWFLAENDENVPYRESIAVLQTAAESNPDLTVVTVHDAGHAFVVSDGAGGSRYTNEYWGRMGTWLDEYVMNR
jgi:alpha-beta hydrolase superfamily lysophospholipase